MAFFFCAPGRSSAPHRLPGTALAALLLACHQIGPAIASQRTPIAIVAAENCYGDVATQIGGAAVTVRSILSSPAQDPHLFEVTPSAARAMVRAQVVIYNGIDYDPWMAKLLEAAPASGQQRIVVAELMGRKNGDNPHIWFNPATMPALAQTLSARLSQLDPMGRAEFERRLIYFRQSMQPIASKVAALHQRFAGTPVAATEPVLNELLDALGLSVRERAFQRAVMNNTEPSASEVVQFEQDLARRQVQLLIYNEQSAGPLAQHMKALAEANHVPVLGVTETEPGGQRYQEWMLGVLSALEQALAAGKGRV